ncbi:hypothetical protein OG21DRAFT_1503167 [Imleria badia]|nr:hypothetical protein OG21DRAFT_1503167 [Imleria badia]
MTDHDCEYDCTHDGIAEQKTNGTTIREGGGRSDEKAGTDDTTNTGRILGSERRGEGGIYLIMATWRFLSCLWSLFA